MLNSSPPHQRPRDAGRNTGTGAALSPFLSFLLSFLLFYFLMLICCLSCKPSRKPCYCFLHPSPALPPLFLFVILPHTGPVGVGPRAARRARRSPCQAPTHQRRLSPVRQVYWTYNIYSQPGPTRAHLPAGRLSLASGKPPPH